MSFDRLSDELLKRIFKLALHDDPRMHQQKASFLLISPRLHNIVAKLLYAEVSINFAKDVSVRSLYQLLEHGRIWKRGAPTNRRPLIRKQLLKLTIYTVSNGKPNHVLEINAILSLCTEVTHLTFTWLPTCLAQSPTFQRLLKARNILYVEIEGRVTCDTFDTLARCCPNLISLVLEECDDIVSQRPLPVFNKVVNLHLTGAPLDMIRMQPTCTAALTALSLDFSLSDDADLIQAVLVHHEKTLKRLFLTVNSGSDDDFCLPFMPNVTELGLDRLSERELAEIMSSLHDNFPAIKRLVLDNQLSSPVRFLTSLQRFCEEGPLQELSFRCLPHAEFWDVVYDRLGNDDILFQYTDGIVRADQQYVLQSRLLQQYRDLCQKEGIWFTQNDFGLDD